MILIEVPGVRAHACIHMEAAAAAAAGERAAFHYAPDVVIHHVTARSHATDDAFMSSETMCARRCVFRF